jgi:hypothetical protein
MKKIFMLISLLVLLTTAGFATSVETSVKVNEDYLYADTAHMLEEDTVFVVGRYLVEGLGGQIEWLEATQTVKMTLDDTVVSLVIDETQANVNGETIVLNKAPYISEGRTMIPLRLVSEYFGYEVAWDQSTFTVNITKEGYQLPEAYRYDRPYTDEDLYLLSKIVTVESGDVSLEMAMAIANTVLNRVKSNQFPNSVADVIYQVDVHVQFPPAHKASFKTLVPTSMSKIAAKKALEGVNNIGESLFFNNQPFRSKTDDLIKVIDGEYFYK